MITLILGKKGSGKTKRLVAMCEEATVASKGNVVFIEKGETLTFNLNHQTRLAVAEEYGVSGFDGLYGFIAGLFAGNYDITDVFVDQTLKIGGGDVEAFGDFIEKLAKLGEKVSAKMVLSVSADKEEIPEKVHNYVEEL